MTFRDKALEIYKEKTKNLIPENALSSSDFFKNRTIIERDKPADQPKTEFTSQEVKDIYKEMLKDLELRNDLSFSK